MRSDDPNLTSPRTGGSATEGTEDIEAKENVRRSVESASTANLEHGASGHDDGKLEEYGATDHLLHEWTADRVDGDGGCNEGCQQGDEETIRQDQH